MHYLYRHIRIDKNEPFYIGIGTKSNRVRPNIRSEYRRAYYIDRKGSSIWNNIAGKTDYEVQIMLESDNYDFIKQKEIEFIKLYGRINIGTGCLANMTNGGDGTIGHIKSEEQIERHKIWMTGRKQSRNTIEKRIISRIGYKHSELTKQKISDSHKGKKVSKEHIRKLHEGQILVASKPIDQYDLDNNFIRSWQSATIAANEIGCHPTSIRQCVVGKTKTSNGYIWKSQISYK